MYRDFIEQIALSNSNPLKGRIPLVVSAKGVVLCRLRDCAYWQKVVSQGSDNDDDDDNNEGDDDQASDDNNYTRPVPNRIKKPSNQYHSQKRQRNVSQSRRMQDTESDAAAIPPSHRARPPVSQNKKSRTSAPPTEPSHRAPYTYMSTDRRAPTSRLHVNASPPCPPRKRQREWADDVGFQGAVDTATGHPNQRRQQRTNRYWAPADNVDYGHNSDDYDGGCQADSGRFVSRRGTSRHPLNIPSSSHNRQYHSSFPVTRQPQILPHSQLRNKSNTRQRSAAYGHGGAGDPQRPVAGPSRYDGHLQQPEYAIMEDDEMGESEDLAEEWGYNGGYGA